MSLASASFFSSAALSLRPARASSSLFSAFHATCIMRVVSSAMRFCASATICAAAAAALSSRARSVSARSSSARSSATCARLRSCAVAAACCLSCSCSARVSAASDLCSACRMACRCCAAETAALCASSSGATASSRSVSLLRACCSSSIISRSWRTRSATVSRSRSTACTTSLRSCSSRVRSAHLLFSCTCSVWSFAPLLSTSSRVLARWAKCRGVPEKSARFESTAMALRGGDTDRREARTLASLWQYGFGCPWTSSPKAEAWNDCCDGEPMWSAAAGQSRSCSSARSPPPLSRPRVSWPR
mmetsp:Transcript_71216/g.171934  ORF Transcript_71216/g.171934 Transcript_71216/m.171934 type:complete len:303 (+) Transcript_71216:852-1760(+)